MICNFDGLNPMQSGRVQKALDRKYRYSCGVMTLGQWLESKAAAGELHRKFMTNGMAGYNRIKFNRMDGAEQAAYLKRLESKRVANVEYGDGYAIEIPKIVYDILALPESSQ